MRETDVDYDYSDEEFTSLERDQLIEIIKNLRKQNDELKGIQRTPEGEVIISDDELIEDNEEVII